MKGKDPLIPAAAKAHVGCCTLPDTTCDICTMHVKKCTCPAQNTHAVHLLTWHTSLYTLHMDAVSALFDMPGAEHQHEPLT